MPRLFVAVQLPASVRDAVWEAVAPLRAALPRLRWVDPSRYHLTVVFVGSVDESLVGDVSAAVAAGCRGFASFPLALDGTVGAFGRRVLWAGLDHSAPLADLAAAVAARVGGVVALPDGDREFRAHLTLARARGREPLRPGGMQQVEVPRLAWPVRRVVLLRSAGGYHEVAGYGLRV